MIRRLPGNVRPASQAACSRIEAAPRPAPSSTPQKAASLTVKTLDADLNILTFRADLWISEHVNPERVVHRRSHRDAPSSN